MAPDEASWATFMEQVEHGLDLPWANLPQVKKYKEKEKNNCFKMAANSYHIIHRRSKHFAFVASQRVSAYIQYHN